MNRLKDSDCCMKEMYYRTDNLNKQAEEFLQMVLPYRERHRWSLQKNSAALLIVDMQLYFLVGDSHADVPSGRSIIPKIKQLQETFLLHNLPVIQTRHVNTRENAGRMNAWWGDILTEDNPLSSIVRDLQADRVDIITKPQYDAFLYTDLEEHLKSNGITQLVITGVMTHLCCETTARSAFMRGFDVLFTIDGTATYREDFHRSSLLNLAHGFAIPVLIHEILNALVGKSQ